VFEELKIIDPLKEPTAHDRRAADEAPRLNPATSPTKSATSSGRLYWEYGGGRSPALSAGEMFSEISLPVAITVFPA
jgi:hypothetical protein